MRDRYYRHVAQIMRETIRESSLQWSVPVPIHSLIHHSGFMVVEAPLRPRFEAALVATGSTRIIFVNQSLGPFAQRFALAHELVHAWHHTGCSGSDHPFLAEMETEANAGAAELLLPYDWFMETASRLVGDRLQTGVDLTAFLASPEARHWAGQARVTLSVLGYHLRDLGFVQKDPSASLTPLSAEL